MFLPVDPKASTAVPEYRPPQHHLFQTYACHPARDAGAYNLEANLTLPKLYKFNLQYF